MAHVLYNIGCLNTIAGNVEDRSDSESMKAALNYYQSAAWAFHTLPDLHKFDEITDYNVDYVATLAQICLAQAQECILEKSILDHKKASIITKVGAQVVEFYKAAMRKIESSHSNMRMVCSLDYLEDMLRFCNFKHKFYGCISRFYMGISYEEDSKWGESVAYFQKSYQLLQSISGKKSSTVFQILRFIFEKSIFFFRCWKTLQYFPDQGSN